MGRMDLVRHRTAPADARPWQWRGGEALLHIQCTCSDAQCTVSTQLSQFVHASTHRMQANALSGMLRKDLCARVHALLLALLFETYPAHTTALPLPPPPPPPPALSAAAAAYALRHRHDFETELHQLARRILSVDENMRDETQLHDLSRDVRTCLALRRVCVEKELMKACDALPKLSVLAARACTAAKCASEAEAACRLLQCSLVALITEVCISQSECTRVNDSLTSVQLHSFERAARSALARTDLPRGAVVAAAGAVAALVVHRAVQNSSQIDLALLQHARACSMTSSTSFTSELVCVELVRAAVEMPLCNSFKAPLLTAEQHSAFDILKVFAHRSADVHVRTRALGGLVSIIKTISDIKKKADTKSFLAEQIPRRYTTCILDLACNRSALPGATAALRAALNALLSANRTALEHHEIEFCQNAFAKLLNTSRTNKGAYAAIASLIPIVGATYLLRSHPAFAEDALSAAAELPFLGKHVAEALAALWMQILKEEGNDIVQFHNRASVPLLNALAHANCPRLNTVATEHALPAYMRVVERSQQHAAVTCITKLLVNSLQESKLYNASAKARATVAVLAAARPRGGFTFGECHCDSNQNNTAPLIAQLRLALRCADAQLRAAALQLVVNAKETTAPITAVEFNLVLYALPTGLAPACTLAEHSRLRHSLRAFLERLKEAYVAASNAAGYWLRLRKESYAGIRTAEFEARRNSFLQSVNQFLTKFTGFLIASVYPGANCARKATALETLVLVLNSFGMNEGVFEPLQRLCISKSAIASACVAALVDDWERPRTAALQLASAMKGLPVMEELPGDDNKTAESILKFAVDMLYSARKREACSGALLCRLVFRLFAQEELEPAHASKQFVSSSPPVLLPAPATCTSDTAWRTYLESADNAVIHSQFRDILFAYSVLFCIEEKINAAKSDLTRACNDGLFHGLLHLMSCIAQDLVWNRTNSSPERLSALQKFCANVLATSRRCIDVAIKGIALEGAYTVVEQDLVSNILTDDVRQRVSTACFLSVKEVCVLLGLLAQNVPFTEPRSPSSENRDTGSGNSNALFTLKDLRSIGEILDFVLRSTRHWGVIDGAAEGLQLTCESLLRCTSIECSALPKQWAMAVISSATKGETYVLRRSAGIPFYVLAIVRAEAATRWSPSMPILSSVIERLIENVQKTELDQESTSSPYRTKKEESVAHSLNLLRALFLDRNLSNIILRYLSSAMMLSIEGFASSSWLIRNSAMMLFAALIRRGVGAPQERKKSLAVSSFDVSEETTGLMEARQFGGATAQQFFARYPELHPFLLKHLSAAVENFQCVDASDHPSLFPVLYLLSSFAPPSAEEGTGEFSLSAFLRLLEQCLQWRSDYVRRASSAGILSLLENPNQVVSMLASSLRDRLPLEPVRTFLSTRVDQLSFENSSVDLQVNGNVMSSRTNPVVLEEDMPQSLSELRLENTRTVALKQNQLHGELLRILAILNSFWGRISEDDRVQVLGCLSKELPQRLWLAENDEKNSCSITRSYLILVLLRSIEVSMGTDRDKITLEQGISQGALVEPRQVLLALGRETARCCLRKFGLSHTSTPSGIENGSFIGHSNLLRTSAELACVEIFFSAQLQIRTVSSALHAYAELLSHPAEEVREKAAVHTAKFLNLYMPRADDNEHLHQQILEATTRASLLGLFDIVTDFIQNESREHLLVQYLILGRSLVVLLPNAPLTSLVALGIRAESILSTSPCLDAREHALRMLGEAASISKSEKLNCIWTACVEARSQPSEPLSMRLACAASLGDRRVHENKFSIGAYLALLDLLEDDHSDVRRAAAGVVAPDALSLGVIHATMNVYTDLCTEYFHHTKLILHFENVLGYEDSHPLHEILTIERLDASIPDDPLLSEESSSDELEDDGEDEEDDDFLRLFAPERDNTNAETVLRQQLVVNACASINVTHVKRVPGILSKLALQAAEELRRGDVNTFADAVLRAGNAMDFERTFASIARFAAVAALYRKQQVEADAYVAAQTIRATMKEIGKLIHPALSFAAEAAANMAEKRGEGFAEALRDFTFLLN